jgi:hypothetical protein
MEAGTPTKELNVNELMKKQLAAMRNHFEEYAVNVQGLNLVEMSIMSAAISLKRLANNQDTVRLAAAALNDNSYKVVDALNEMVEKSDHIVSAIRNVEDELGKLGKA